MCVCVCVCFEKHRATRLLVEHRGNVLRRGLDRLDPAVVAAVAVLAATACAQPLEVDALLLEPRELGLPPPPPAGTCVSSFESSRTTRIFAVNYK